MGIPIAPIATLEGDSRLNDVPGHYARLSPLASGADEFTRPRANSPIFDIPLSLHSVAGRSGKRAGDRAWLSDIPSSQYRGYYNEYLNSAEMKSFNTAAKSPDVHPEIYAFILSINEMTKGARIET